MKLLRFILITMFTFTLIIFSCSRQPIIIDYLNELQPKGFKGMPNVILIDNSLPYDLTSDTFVLEWDAPDTTTDITNYLIYFKPHNTYSWIHIATLLDTEFNYTINLNSLLTYVNVATRKFDFGVSSKYLDGDSIIHSSLDYSAIPSNGWHINWIK